MNNAERPVHGGQKVFEALDHGLKWTIHKVRWTANLSAAQIGRIFPDLSPNHITVGGVAIKILYDLWILYRAKDLEKLSKKERIIVYPRICSMV